MKNPWIAFYFGDYLTDTTHLTQGQHGAYLLLLARYFTSGKPLLANDKQLLRICLANTEQECDNVRAVLEEFFYRDGDFYRNKRADAELERRLSISKQRSLAGRKGASSKCLANAEQLPIQSQSQLLVSKNKPSLEEVRLYCVERKNSVDPQKWFDHYSANGWKVGKVPMRDWKAAVRTWEKSDFGNKEDKYAAFARKHGGDDDRQSRFSESL